MLATVVEITIAVFPTGLALELALASPVVTRLAVAVMHPRKVKCSKVEVSSATIEASRVRTRGSVRLGGIVVQRPLATSLPLAVLVGAEERLADREIARAAIREGVVQALAPVEWVETVELVAFDALALSTASTVAERVSLATSHRVQVAVVPAIVLVADEIALTSVCIRRVVHASNPSIEGNRRQVRAGENIAVTSGEVVRRKRPELQEWAPNTSDLRAQELTVGPVLAEERVIVCEVVIKPVRAILKAINVALIIRDTLLEKIDWVIDCRLATVRPEVILVNAEVAVASAIIRLAENSVELAEEVANGVTSNIELNVAKAVVDETRCAWLVIN